MARKGSVRRKKGSSCEKILHVGKRMFPFGSTGWGWDPILCLESIRMTMNSLYSGLFQTSASFFDELPWIPQIDLYIREDKLIAEVVLPGTRKENISVHAASTLLIIGGEVKRDREVKEADTLVGERRLGRFHRSIPLPFDIVPEETMCELREGILSIVCPIRERS